MNWTTRMEGELTDLAELPVMVAIYTGDIGCHWFISTPGLHLEVGCLSLFTLGTLELVG
jgi:hypothetical protein